MNDDNKESWLWPIGAITSLLFAVVGIVLMILGSCTGGRVSRVNPCTANAGDCFSIQGLYSKPGCPGQHVMPVEVDGQNFFLECYQ